MRRKPCSGRVKDKGVTDPQDEAKERQALLKQLADLQTKLAAHWAEVATLSPEERATFDRLWEESQRDQAAKREWRI